MISQGAWVVRIVGIVGLYLFTWGFLRPQNSVQTFLALLAWFLPMLMWWINSEKIYRWLRHKLNR
jgi:hypothetical protein